MRPQELFLKINKSLKRRGLVGTANHCWARVAALTVSLTPAGRRRRESQKEIERAFARKRQAIDADFDAHHNLDTGGKIELCDLSIESESKEHGVFYQAVFPERFKQWIDSLNIEPRNYLFVDIGAGKGRALFLAQDMAFKRVEGVEFAEELVDVCKRNIQIREAEGVPRPAVSILHVDALLYVLPDEPVVLFVNNPFGGEVMKKFVDRLRRSLSHRRHVLKIVYGNPLCDEAFMNGIPRLERLLHTERVNTYQWTPHKVSFAS